jgi:hypothetical protein
MFVTLVLSQDDFTEELQACNKDWCLKYIHTIRVTMYTVPYGPISRALLDRRTMASRQNTASTRVTTMSSLRILVAHPDSPDRVLLDPRCRTSCMGS